jgi:uncharacterized protein YnzC (UPF0291/DUF896 family)
MTFSLIAFSLCMTSLSHADELDDIQRSRESAEMKYVNELGTGKYKTAPERDALKKQYIEPYQQKTKEYFKSISVMPTARPVKPEEIDLRSGPKTDLSSIAPLAPVAPASSQSSGQITGHTVSSGSTPPAPDKSSLRPEFVLDGSNVPKEIVFGAPSFDEAKPQPSPSPSPAAKKARSW